MEVSRRDMLKAAAVVAAAGPLTFFEGGVASAAARPSAARATARMGSGGPEVLALQQRLSALGYWLGVKDGHFGDLTRQAVVLVRNGECGPTTWARVDAGTRPRARSVKGHVIEVSKATQTLLVVDSGVVRRIYNLSTGSSQRYFSEGRWQVALTPSGSFRVFRHVNAWDRGPLGPLYRPKYFSRGVAIHGYPSVPSTPVSHGCCRVSLPAMDSLWGKGVLELGTPILVY